MTNMTKRQAERWIKRTRKFVEARHKEHDPNSRAAARRRKQMVEGKLTPSNGVVPEYEGDISSAPMGSDVDLDGTSGQDRESYSDDQDRESYNAE